MITPLEAIDITLNIPLEIRQKNGLIRNLSSPLLLNNSSNNLIDFSSNDYLGLGQFNSFLQKNLRKEFKSYSIEKGPSLSGSTSSRLLDGNHLNALKVEDYAKLFHQTETALLFNSGYDANVSLISSIARHHDYLIYDELIHASIHDGLKLSKCNNQIKFNHNDLIHLKEILINLNRNKDSHIFIIVESLYSMDGDFSNLSLMLELCKTFNCLLIIDEAHSAGIFGKKGKGSTDILLNSNKLNNQYILARIITLGKAFACHGALILGSKVLKSYLINYSRPLIYSTFLSPVTAISILKSYQIINSDLGDKLRLNLFRNIQFYQFYSNKNLPSKFLLKSKSQIQLILTPSNQLCLNLSNHLQSNQFMVRPIRSPTVDKGKERVRICLRATHQINEIKLLIDNINKFYLEKRPDLLIDDNSKL